LRTPVDPKTPFSKKVLKLIRSVPRGRVTTYGTIAHLAGKPHGARGVGWLLHSCSKLYKLPWQRVIKSDGRLSFPEHSREFVIQRNLLEREGIKVIDGRVDLKKYFWKKPKERS
jgi:methylated-DNA-protein-cysteine methyltransferase related protein